LFTQVWVPLQPKSVVHACVVLFTHSPQDCVSEGLSVVVPQELVSVQVLL